MSLSFATSIRGGGWARAGTVPSAGPPSSCGGPRWPNLTLAGSGDRQRERRMSACAAAQHDRADEQPVLVDQVQLDQAGGGQHVLVQAAAAEARAELASLLVVEPHQLLVRRPVDRAVWASDEPSSFRAWASILTLSRTNVPFTLRPCHV